MVSLDSAGELITDSTYGSVFPRGKMKRGKKNEIAGSAAPWAGGGPARQLFGSESLVFTRFYKVFLHFWGSIWAPSEEGPGSVKSLFGLFPGWKTKNEKREPGCGRGPDAGRTRAGRGPDAVFNFLGSFTPGG